MRRIIKQKDVVIPFCEGEAEIKVFGFLKSKYLKNNKIVFKKPIDLGGFSSYAAFEKNIRDILKPKT